jgi:hypothetical protein
MTKEHGSSGLHGGEVARWSQNMPLARAVTSSVGRSGRDISGEWACTVGWGGTVERTVQMCGRQNNEFIPKDVRDFFAIK